MLKNDLLYFLTFYVVRVFNSLLIRTYLHPDEYWQSIEPAHLNVYGFLHIHNFFKFY